MAKFQKSFFLQVISWIVLIQFFHVNFNSSAFAVDARPDRLGKTSTSATSSKVAQENVLTEYSTLNGEPSKNLNSTLSDIQKLDAEAQKNTITPPKTPVRKMGALPIVAVLDVFSTSLSGPELQEVSNSLRREVTNSGRYLVYSKSDMKKALSKNLDQEIAASRRIDEFIGEARRLYDDFKFGPAASLMKEAMKTIATFDASRAVARKISEAYLTQGLIFEAEGREQEAGVSFLNAAALDPERQLDPIHYPPNVISKFYQAKVDFPKIKKGSLRILTENTQGVHVLIGSKDLGTTPVTLHDLPLGIQKVALVKEGFETWEKNVMIVQNLEESSDDKKYVNQLSVVINRVGDSVSLDALMGEVVSRKDYESQISKIGDVGKLLEADQIFAARIEKSGSGYDFFLTAIDTPSSKEIAKGYAAVDPKLADMDVSIVHALADLTVGKPPEKSTGLLAVEGKGTRYLASYKKNKPFYKRWPFYVLMGAAVAGGGTGAALLLTRSSPPMGSATISGAPQP